MSKKMIMLSLAVLFGMQAGLAMATNPDTGPGCGLGKLLWADSQKQKNIAPQVMMATTNGTGMNTFAISSGTSGCTNDGKIMAEYKTTVFVSLNFENLSQEMAQGQGEHLASLASLMGVPAEHQGGILRDDPGALYLLANSRRSLTGRNGQSDQRCNCHASSPCPGFGSLIISMGLRC